MHGNYPRTPITKEDPFEVLHIMPPHKLEFISSFSKKWDTNLTVQLKKKNSHNTRGPLSRGEEKESRTVLLLHPV